MDCHLQQLEYQELSYAGVIKSSREYLKRPVAEDMGIGGFDWMTQTRLHQRIPGAQTVRAWIKQYGRNHLQAKVVWVDGPDEQDRLRACKKRVAQLEQVLGVMLPKNRGCRPCFVAATHGT